MPNKRIFYAVHQVGFNANDGSSYSAVHGVQSVGMTTNFNLSQVFELGQIAIYANIEDLPDIQVSLSKCLDGWPLIYHEATKATTTTDPTLAGRSTSKCKFALSIFADTNNSAVGAPLVQAEMSGMFVNSVAYSFPLDSPFKEDVTLVGNNRIWGGNGLGAISVMFSGAFTTNTDAPANTNSVNQREHLLLSANSGLGVDNNSASADPNATVLPPDVFGINASGVNIKSNGADYDAHLVSIDISADLGREAINELGRKGPYHRYVTFPIAVDCSITVTSISGDMIQATESGIIASTSTCGIGTNLRNRTIRVATCEGTRIYLGLKNKLESVEYTGGDSTGGNVQVTYKFKTFNDFTVLHSGDPHASGATWWTNRSTYLVN